MKKKKDSYTSAIKELEVIIYTIENEDVNVDDLSELVKRAADLVKQCQLKLRTTEEELNKTLSDLD